MNLNNMVSLIQTRLGFRDDIQDQVINEINLAQYALERDVTFNPHFLWRAKDICICPECVDYALPPGFLRLDEFSNPLFQPDGVFTSYELSKGIAATSYEPNKLAGCVTSFSIYAGNLRLNARACGLLRLFYITATTQLSLIVVENLWTQHAFDVLMNKAGMALASALEEQAAFALFSAEYAMTLRRFKTECVAYEDQGMNVARGDSLYKSPVKAIGGWYEAGSLPCEGCA